MRRAALLIAMVAAVTTALLLDSTAFAATPGFSLPTKRLEGAYKFALQDRRFDPAGCYARPPELAKILTKLEKAGWEVKGDRLATKPRGYDADHPRLDLLRYRSVYATRTWPPDDTLHESGLLSRVRTAWRALRPFNEWARDRVGLSEQARR